MNSEKLTPEEFDELKQIKDMVYRGAWEVELEKTLKLLNAFLFMLVKRL